MKYFLALLALLISSSAFACKFMPDKRPFNEQVRESPIAFIGTVTKSQEDGTVTFSVDSWVKGGSGDTYTFTSEKTSCDIEFSVGQRWIFGGGKMYNPSRLINDKNGDFTVKYRQIDAANLDVSIAQQVCFSNNQCKIVDYGCGRETAVNNLFYPSVIKAINERRATEGACPASKNHPSLLFEEARCVSNHCSVFGYHD